MCVAPHAREPPQAKIAETIKLFSIPTLGRRTRMSGRLMAHGFLFRLSKVPVGVEAPCRGSSSDRSSPRSGYTRMVATVCLRTGFQARDKVRGLPHPPRRIDSFWTGAATRRRNPPAGEVEAKPRRDGSGTAQAQGGLAPGGRKAAGKRLSTEQRHRVDTDQEAKGLPPRGPGGRSGGRLLPDPLRSRHPHNSGRSQIDRLHVGVPKGAVA
jgi:hypothetical protein